MIKLNNKGLTMIELIISVALISVVMTFLYRLLADVQYDRDNEFFASRNQEQRIEIINFMQNLIRFNENTTYITSINTDPGKTKIVISLSTGSQFQMIPNYTDNTITIKDTTVAGGTGVLRTWEIEQGTLGVPYCSSDASSTEDELYPVECVIPIYTLNNSNTKDNNNTIDDIKIVVLKGKRK